MRVFSSTLSRLLSFFIFVSIFPRSLSLHVVPGSNCTALCSFQDLSSNTTSDEITCQDKRYENTAVGKIFKDCVTCEFESKSFDHGTGQTDVGWGLYNIRFASNWCLFGAGASTNEPSTTSACDNACQPTQKSLDVNSDDSTTPTPYGYCEDLDTVAFTNCAMCHAQVSEHAYLSNFLRVLSTACEWKILPPMGFPIKGSQVFAHKAPSNYSTLGPNSSPQKSSGLSNQSKLAIGIAIPIILFLILCGLFLFWYFRVHLSGKSLNRRSFEAEPEFQMYERRGEKSAYPPLTPDSSWHENTTPTIYHPTPALALQHTHNTRHHHAAIPPAHLRLHATTTPTTTKTTPRLSHQQKQGQYYPSTATTATATMTQKPNIKIETGAIMAAAPSVRSSNSSPPQQLLRKISLPLSSSPPSAMHTEEKEGVGGREREVGVGMRNRDRGREAEDRGSTIQRGKFHLPSLGSILSRGNMTGNKEKEKQNKEGKKRFRGKKDAAGSEDLFS